MTLATLAPTTTEALPLIDFKDTLEMETDLLYLFLIVLAIVSISVIIHLIILFVKYCIPEKQCAKSVPNDQETFIKVTLTNLTSSVELCVKKLPIPSSNISVAVLKDKISTPQLSHCCVVFPQLNFDWDFLKISFTESDSTVELPSTFLISPILALKYWKIKGGTFILRVTMETGDQVQDLLSHNLNPFKLRTDYVPLQQLRPLPPDPLTPA